MNTYLVTILGALVLEYILDSIGTSLNLKALSPNLPTEFDGEGDALFEPFDKFGNKLIDYLDVIVTYPDLPYSFILDHIKRRYGRLLRSVFWRVNKGEMFYKGWS